MANTLIEQVRGLLRITGSDFDFEVEDLIYQAVQDLIASGLNPEAIDPDTLMTLTADVIDPNIRRAICLYCKAYFGIENPDKDWFAQQYQFKKAEILNQITLYVDVGDEIV